MNEGKKQNKQNNKKKTNGTKNLNVIPKRVIIQVQSFIIKCLSFPWVSFAQGYMLCIEKLCTWIILSYPQTGFYSLKK